MARYTGFPSGRATIDALSVRWRNECLIEDGSLLFDDRHLWRPGSLDDFRNRFLLEGRAATTFAEKLAVQLETASDDLRWLAAELLVVYALPVANLFGYRGKIEVVRQALGQLDLSATPHWSEVDEAFREAIGHPGVRYNARRDIHIEYLVDFALRVKARSLDDRREVLGEPWRTEQLADEPDQRLRGEMRHAVLHLLHPDEFERIFSRGHKQRVADTFSPEVALTGEALPADLDRRLFAIRQHLEADKPEEVALVDFYTEPYENQWRPKSPPDDDGGDHDDRGPRWFWVNQGQTYGAELQAGILWAPLRSKNNLQLHHWDRMNDVRTGDVILHYSGAIRALSKITASAVNSHKPVSFESDAWEQEGRLLRADYIELRQPIPVNDIPSPWRTKEEGGPFTHQGSVQQGYLFSLQRGFVAQMLGRFDELREAAGVKGSGLIPGGDRTLQDVHDQFAAGVARSGLLIELGRVRALTAALVAKPFAIFSGLSGSGKTQLALRLGEWFCTTDRSRRLTVAVRPDWTGPESLFGYEDALRAPSGDGRAAWYVPQALEFLLVAATEPEQPYLLLLDEMNLAHVERYFSDFLSGAESGDAVLPNLVRENGVWRTVLDGPAFIELPTNLFVIGTVNVDETTYLFSPKVLDRAFTFEIRTPTSSLRADLAKPTPVPGGEADALAALARIAQDKSWHLEHPHPRREQLLAQLRTLHEVLSDSGDEFGHRVLYESLRFSAALAAAGEPEPDAALDQIVLLKLLPRIHGSRRRVEPVLRRLARFTEDPNATAAVLRTDSSLGGSVALPLARTKVDRMLELVAINQFVSFSE